MKVFSAICALFTIIFTGTLHSQTSAFKENNKWGIRENNSILIKPLYDTVINFNGSGNACLACHKTMGASVNKFIKSLTKIYLCNYLDRTGKRLVIQTGAVDTCSVFTLGKHTVKQFTDNPNYFIVSVKSKKHLVDKNFKQLTFKGYHEILFPEVPSYIIAQKMDEANTISTGLIDYNEETVVPFQYSDIRINTNDSLIVACSAGVRTNADDDVFNYQGKKVGAYRRHIDMATRNFIIHKIYEPREYYIVYNIETKEEKIQQWDEVRFFQHDEILVRTKNNWYVYNLVTGEKRPGKQP